MTTWTPPPPSSAATYVQEAAAAASFDTCGEASLGGSHATRSTFTDFSGYGGAYGGGSLSVRTDAVADTQVVGYAPGPYTVGSETSAEAYAWKARSDGSTVWLARSDTGAWGSETSLFDYTGAALETVALGFEKSGNPVVAGEREGRVWLYYFDTLDSAYTFASLTPGSRPLVVLDDARSALSFDAQVFYTDAAGSVLHREQRSRYQSEVTTPFSLTSLQRLERVGHLHGQRLVLLYSEWVPASSSYTLGRFYSQPFPQHFTETLAGGGALSAGTLTEIPGVVPDGMALAGLLTEGWLRAETYFVSLTETLSFSGGVQTGTLRVLDQRASLTETLALAGGVRSLGTLVRDVVFSNATHEFLSLRGGPSYGTLE